MPRPLLRLGCASTLIALGFSGASAESLRDFCPDRPGLGTPACTMDPGHFDVELGIADWTLDREPASRTDDLTYGDLLVRYGLNSRLEAQVHWAGIGTERIHDHSGIRHRTGGGDLTLALRQNLVHPGGSGFSVALMPEVTLPVGSDPLGAGTSGAGLVVPVSQSLPHGLQLDFTGEVDAAPDADGKGRHLAYGGVVGLDLDLGGDVGATLELEAARDEDPAGAATHLLGGVSLAWMARPSLQLDAGLNAGLDRDAPDVEIYVGISRRF